MSKVIEGVPEYLTHEQYMALFEAIGVAPDQVAELRAAHDGIHAIVYAVDEHGQRIPDWTSGECPGHQKHRVFVPVRRTAEDNRTTRINPIKKGL